MLALFLNGILLFPFLNKYNKIKQNARPKPPNPKIILKNISRIMIWENHLKIIKNSQWMRGSGLASHPYEIEINHQSIIKSNQKNAYGTDASDLIDSISQNHEIMPSCHHSIIPFYY